MREESDFETVYTVTDYYDGPRGGVADFQGSPHVHEWLFDEAVGYLRVFQLSRIDDETFRLALEDWAICRRWERAFHAGLMTQETHPALPEDRPRHEQLSTVLAGRLGIDPDRAVLAKGDFQPRPAAEPQISGIMAELAVRWVVVDKDRA